MIKKINNYIWELNFKSFGSCIYLIKLNEKNILIDTSSAANKKELIEDLQEIKISLSDINIVLLTHNHFDHTGNLELFKNAKIYGSKKDFKDEKILEINNLKINNIEILKTPGHTKGSVCFYISKEKILFSGDTIFHHEGIGRTDFENSSPEEMPTSLQKLKELKYKILLPGHTD